MILDELLGTWMKQVKILSRYRELGLKSVLRRVNCCPKPRIPFLVTLQYGQLEQ
jgi:hypothetical protein